MNPFELTGRVAVITGGNGGIGLGMARGLARAGATVVLAGRTPDKGAGAADGLRALGATAAFLPVDVIQPESCRTLIASVEQQFDRLDILVNNAGMSVRKAPQDITPVEWHTVMDTNLTGALYCSQAAYPAMKHGGAGKIICIGSMMAIFAASYAAAYGASKAGIVQLARTLAVAWAADNIQVNSILPGWISTDLTQSARSEVPGLDARVLARTPAGRWGVPDDLSGIAVFLASPASDFITGAAIPVDGGFSIQS